MLLILVVRHRPIVIIFGAQFSCFLQILHLMRRVPVRLQASAFTGFPSSLPCSWSSGVNVFLSNVVGAVFLFVRRLRTQLLGTIFGVHRRSRGLDQNVLGAGKAAKFSSRDGVSSCLVFYALLWPNTEYRVARFSIYLFP